MQPTKPKWNFEPILPVVERKKHSRETMEEKYKALTKKAQSIRERKLTKIKTQGSQTHTFEQ